MNAKSENILIIEDDPDISKLISWHLESEGYSTVIAEDGITGVELALTNEVDMILLDIMLPGMDGLEVCKTLKRNEKTCDIPIIMITAKGEEIDRIVGFEIGADDYVVKPFSSRELLLRIKAVLRRQKPKSDNAKKLLTFRELCIDLEKHIVKIGDKNIHLTLTEFKLLYELLSNRGRVRTRDQLLDRVWGYHFDGYARTVDTHIRRLRSKLEKYDEYIETIRGVGYRFREE